MGIVLANQRFVAVKHIVEFKENLRVLVISALFVVLAARLKISDLDQIDWTVGESGQETVARPRMVTMLFTGSP